MRYRVLTTTRRHQAIGLMLFVVAILSGCAAHDEVPTPVVSDEPKAPESISLLFACAPDHTVSAFTRMADNVVQSGNTYRTITNFRVIAQKKEGSGVIITSSWVDNPEEIAKYSTFKYYHSGYCKMPKGVNACLVYAKADDATPPAGVSIKVYNGSLTPEIESIPPYISSPGMLSFNLSPIFSDATVGEDGIPTEATALGDALTSIVDGVPQWILSDNPILQNLYSNFTNRGYNIPGSAASVKQWMLTLSDAAKSYLDLTPRPSWIGTNEADILNGIKTTAATAAASITVDATSYPRNINLPDGAAALRWTEVVLDGGVKKEKFVPQLETTTLDNINSVSRFVYPPALYYFVDSEIRTSNSEVDYDGDSGYKNDASWSQVLTRFTDGPTITADTKTVAVADPLQYAVARLQVKVKANDVNLKYAEGSDLTIPINDGATTNYFRLTGVIIDGQRPVDYQFQQSSNLDSDVKFVFDSQVPKNFYLTTTDFEDANAKSFNTLVLESYGGKVADDAEDVKIILEFEYTGTQAFKCLNGYVYPNTRFYLVGEVKALKGDQVTESLDYTKRVFTKDYTTQVLMTVTSLEKAYNVLPSILSKNLEIGVVTTPKWIFATPPDPVVMD